jgi:hypothetical protein
MLDYKCNVQIVKNKQMIFDLVRKRYVKFTPEEWVRQSFVSFLSEHYSYPLPFMQIERKIVLNYMVYRADIVVLDKYGKATILVECKAPNIEIKNNSIEQISRYNTILGAQVIILTNGISMLCWQQSEKDGYVFVKEIPNFRTKKF